MDSWDPEADRRRLECVHVGPCEIRQGDRVRLRPRGRADILDLALAGKTATVEAIEQDYEGRVYLAVTVDDDPGKDLGALRQPGHRFFFQPEEVEAIATFLGGTMTRPRILIAGIGNIFLGDDAFGVEVAQRLARRTLPDEVRVVDFGIRGLDLTYALLDGYETVILVDAVPRGGVPGTLYVMEPARDESAPASIATHGMDPVQVLRLAEAMGGKVEQLLLVGCEPTPVADYEDMQPGLSDPVRAAVEEAIPLLESLIARLLRKERIGSGSQPIIPEREVSTCRE